MVAEKRISKQGAHDVGLEDDEGGADDDNDTALCKPGSWNSKTGEISSKVETEECLNLKLSSDVN